MPHTLAEADLQRLARLGAIARLKEIEAEAAAIRRAFPDLGALAPPAAKSRQATGTAKAAKKPRTWKMSEAAREAARKRMREYWAKKKAAAGTQAEGAAAEQASEDHTAKRAGKRRRAKKARAKKAR